MSVVNTVRGVLMHFDPGAGGVGKRVYGNRAEIARGNKICQMLWGNALVLSVLIDGCTYVVEILSENSFTAGTLFVCASCNKEQREYYERITQS